MHHNDEYDYHQHYGSSRRRYVCFVICWIIFFIIIVVVNLGVSLKVAKSNKDDSGANVLIFFVPALFGIILITVVCLICCVRQHRRNSSYAKLSDDGATDGGLVSPTDYATTATAATSSVPAKDPYNSATVIQAGDSEQIPTADYPPMPQPMFYPVIENYGATDDKP